jgi:Ser/Thr protein kinase RdoA (MazF antagonist)
LIFFWGDHITQDISRGLFTKSEDWLRARLTLVLADQEKILITSYDEGDIEDAEEAKSITQRLLKLLPSIFPPSANVSGESVLFHDDLSMQNILVDDDGKITGVIDWECVSALPLWRAFELPILLTGRDRDEEPKRDQYPGRSRRT